MIFPFGTFLLVENSDSRGFESGNRGGKPNGATDKESRVWTCALPIWIRPTDATSLGTEENFLMSPPSSEKITAARVLPTPVIVSSLVSKLSMRRALSASKAANMIPKEFLAQA